MRNPKVFSLSALIVMFCLAISSLQATYPEENFGGCQYPRPMLGYTPPSIEWPHTNQTLRHVHLNSAFRNTAFVDMLSGRIPLDIGCLHNIWHAEF